MERYSRVCIMNYTPRRCGKQWLDGDCPRGVLAIMDHRDWADRYTVFYAEPIADDGRQSWIGYISLHDNGSYYHGEMEAYQVAQYRYRNKHRYTRWTDLPTSVRAVVLRDLETQA